MDVLIGAMGFTEKRTRAMSFPYSMFKAKFALMIPRPVKQESEIHIDAVWRPFQNEVFTYTINQT